MRLPIPYLLLIFLGFYSASGLTRPPATEPEEIVVQATGAFFAAIKSKDKVTLARLMKTEPEEIKDFDGIFKTFRTVNLAMGSAKMESGGTIDSFISVLAIASADVAEWIDMNFGLARNPNSPTGWRIESIGVRKPTPPGEIGNQIPDNSEFIFCYSSIPHCVWTLFANALGAVL